MHNISSIKESRWPQPSYNINYYYIMTRNIRTLAK